MNKVIFHIEELKNIIAKVACDYKVQKVMLFGSYFDGNPSDESDIDLLVSYGNNCRGLKRIGFMQELEKNLGKLDFSRLCWLNFGWILRKVVNADPPTLDIWFSNTVSSIGDLFGVNYANCITSS